MKDKFQVEEVHLHKEMRIIKVALKKSEVDDIR